MVSVIAMAAAWIMDFYGEQLVTIFLGCLSPYSSVHVLGYSKTDTRMNLRHRYNYGGLSSPHSHLLPGTKRILEPLLLFPHSWVEENPVIQKTVNI